jgi:hypothetical protein
MSTARATIALTAEADAAATEVQNRFSYFKDKMDVAKLGFAWAVAEDLDPDREPGWRIGGTTWSMSSIDRDGQMIELADVLFPSRPEDRAVLCETLVSKGLALIGKRLKAGEIVTLLSRLGEPLTLLCD